MSRLCRAKSHISCIMWQDLTNIFLFEGTAKQQCKTMLPIYLLFILANKFPIWNGKFSYRIRIIYFYVQLGAVHKLCRLGRKERRQKWPILLSKKRAKRGGGGGQKSTILGRHNLWKAPKEEVPWQYHLVLEYIIIYRVSHSMRCHLTSTASD